MKIQKTELAAKLNKIKGVVPKNPQKAVLRGILVKNGYLTASSLEMTVKAKLEGGEGQEDECFIIPERAFDLISSLPDGEVDISATAGDTITIKANKIRNKYQTMDPAQFPAIAELENVNRLTIKADTLLDAIKHVSYAISANPDNALVSAMCMQAEDGVLNFVGMDGHVMAWDRVEYDGEFKLLVPKSTVAKLQSLGLSGDVRIRHNGTGAVFATEGFEVYTRLVEGRYFNYKTVFRELPLHTVVSRVELLDAMTRAKMCTEEKCPARFKMQDSRMDISIKEGITDYYETVDLQEEFAEPLTIGFDARLVLETLKAFDCKNIGISFAGPKMPMVVESDNSDLKALVLPVVIK